MQASELDGAGALAERLLRAVGEREVAPAMSGASTSNRQRAFVLFLRAYDEARRMVTFLRWREDDVDTITPSLYAGRQRSKRRKGQGKPDTAPTGDEDATNEQAAGSSSTSGPSSTPAASSMPEGDLPIA